MIPTIGTETKADGDDAPDADAPARRYASVPLDPGEANALATVAARWRAMGRESEARDVEEAILLGKPRRFADRFVVALEGIVTNAEEAAALREGRAPPAPPWRIRRWCGEGGVAVETDRERRAVALMPATISAAIERAMQEIVDELARRGYASRQAVHSGNASAETLALKSRFSAIAGSAYRLAHGLLAATRRRDAAVAERIGSDLGQLEACLGHSLGLDPAALAPPTQPGLFDADAARQPSKERRR